MTNRNIFTFNHYAKQFHLNCFDKKYHNQTPRKIHSHLSTMANSKTGIDVINTITVKSTHFAIFFLYDSCHMYIMGIRRMFDWGLMLYNHNHNSHYFNAPA